MDFTEEEKVFLISLLGNRLTNLEREYIHSQKRLSDIYSNEGHTDERFKSSLYMQKHKIDLCLDILSKIKCEG